MILCLLIRFIIFIGLIYLCVYIKNKCPRVGGGGSEMMTGENSFEIVEPVKFIKSTGESHIVDRQKELKFNIDKLPDVNAMIVEHSNWFENKNGYYFVPEFIEGTTNYGEGWLGPVDVDAKMEDSVKYNDGKRVAFVLVSKVNTGIDRLIKLKNKANQDKVKLTEDYEELTKELVTEKEKHEKLTKERVTEKKEHEELTKELDTEKKEHEECKERLESELSRNSRPIYISDPVPHDKLLVDKSLLESVLNKKPEVVHITRECPNASSSRMQQVVDGLFKGVGINNNLTGRYQQDAINRAIQDLQVIRPMNDMEALIKRDALEDLHKLNKKLCKGVTISR